MATYKLIQDIEAEDHILGPLTLRQFIFALIGIFLCYLSFLMYAKHFVFMDALFVPPAIFFIFFAIPFGGDQPTEVWFLAKLRFWFKPRKRIWDQSGMKEMVTITAPKKVEPVLTDGLNQYEVQSRLNALANTLDSRGWVVKNSTMNSATTAFMIGGNQQSSDRLVDVGTTAVPEEQVSAESDIFETSSPIAQQFDQMITKSTVETREKLIEKMNAPTPDPEAAPKKSSSNQWFMPHVDNGPKPVYAADVAPQQETPEEEALLKKIKQQHDTQQVYFGNLRTIQPLGSAPTKTDASQKPADNSSQAKSDSPVNDAATDTVNNQGGSPTPPVTPPPDPAILNLANNNDFTVETIAREAKRAKGEELGQDEVVISLH